MRNTAFSKLNSVFCFIFIIATNVAFTQTEAPEPSLKNPYRTIQTHLYFLQPDSYQPGIASMVIPPGLGLDSAARVKKAVRIKRILDGKGLFVQMNRLPRDSNYVDSLNKEHFYTPFPHKLPEVYLERIDGKWYYSMETTRSVDELYNSIFPFGADLFADLFPASEQKEFLGLQAWQWFWIFILLIGAALLHFIFQRILRPVIASFFRKREELFLTKPKLLLAIARVLSLIGITMLLRLFIPSLQLHVKAAQYVQTAFAIFLTALFAVLLFRAADVLIARMERLAMRTESKMDEQALPIIDKVLKIIIVIGAFIQVFSLLSVNVTTLVAGIGIGGLALALAAQDAIKNFIGSIMVFLDKPFQIGDFIEGSGFVGTVIEVGFRSTRLQALDTTIITIPNGGLSNMQIKNYGRRKYRFLDTKIGLTYDTPPDLMEQFMKGIEQIILEHPKLVNEDYFIRFTNMAESALEISVRGYLEAETYAEELKIEEELYMAIMRLAHALGISFAFPSRTLYVEQFPEKESKEPTYKQMESDSQGRMEEFFRRYKLRLMEDYPE